MPTKRAYTEGESAEIRCAILNQTKGYPWSDWTNRVIDLLGDILTGPFGRPLADNLATGMSPADVVQQIIIMIEYERETIDLIRQRLKLSATHPPHSKSEQ